MTAALEVTDLRVETDAGVLLSAEALSLEPGSLTVVTGPTDSGKTLLAAVLCGRATATGGTVHLGGRLLGGSPSARRRRGLAGTVADGGRVSGCTVAEALALAGSQRAGAALERFPLLAQRRHVRAELLSGGEQQVLQVACAWCAAPRVLVLDAPTTGLASDAAAAVAQLVSTEGESPTAVLWLDQTDDAAPQPASWRLDAGVLSPVREAETPSGSR